MTNGLDDFATNTELREALRAPFPPHLIAKVNKGFGPVDTLNHAVVTDRLNKVAPGWTTSEPQVITVQGNDGLPHVVGVVCSMTIGSVTRWECGEVEHPSTYGDELKKAMSDFVKRAAMRFGVGLDLWSKEDLQASPAATDTRVPSPTAPSVSPGASVEWPGQPADAGQAVLEDRAAETGEAAAVPSEDGLTTQTGVDGSTATDAQWANLISTVGGSKAKAREAVNDANGTKYTAATVRYATADEVAAALAKVVLSA